MNKAILILMIIVLSNIVFGLNITDQDVTLYKNGSAMINNTYINDYTKYVTDNLLKRLNITDEPVVEEVVEEVKEKVELPPPTSIGYIILIIVIIVAVLIGTAFLIYTLLFKGSEYNIDKHMDTKGKEITDIDVDEYLKKI